MMLNLLSQKLKNVSGCVWLRVGLCLVVAVRCQGHEAGGMGQARNALRRVFATRVCEVIRRKSARNKGLRDVMVVEACCARGEIERVGAIKKPPFGGFLG